MFMFSRQTGCYLPSREATRPLLSYYVLISLFYSSLFSGLGRVLALQTFHLTVQIQMLYKPLYRRTLFETGDIF